eukprot:7448319-Lingulodinium_polyedra.AAC.1
MNSSENTRGPELSLLLRTPNLSYNWPHGKGFSSLSSTIEPTAETVILLARTGGKRPMGTSKKKCFAERSMPFASCSR